MNINGIFYPILLVLILISSLYVLTGSINVAGTNITISNVINNSIRSSPTLYDVVQMNGSNARYNLTILLDDPMLISIVNITLPSNLTYTYSVSGKNNDVNGSVTGLQGIDGQFNATNFTSNYNVTNDSRIGLPKIIWTRIANGTEYESGIFSLNLTAMASDESASDPDLIPMNWEIYVLMSNGSTVATNLTTYVDTAPPRMTELNITDGNTTMFNISASSLNFADGTLAISNSSLTVSLALSESNFRALNMYYLCNITPGVTALGYDGTAGTGFHENVSMTTSDTVSPYLYTGTINNNCIDAGVNVDNFTMFFFEAHDKAGWKRNLTVYTSDNAPTESSAFAFKMINNSVPLVRAINISDAVGGAGGSITLVAGMGKLNGIGDFVGVDRMITINLEVTGRDLEPNATLFYIVNETDQHANITDGAFFEDGLQIILANISGNVTSPDEPAIIVYNGTIGKGRFNDTALNTTINFLLLLNGSGNSYTYRFRGAFAVDGDVPTATITAPADTTITTQNSITYKCSGSDGDGSGVATCSLKFTRPDGTTETFSTCSNKALSGESTGQAGTYTVDCTVTDSTDNSKAATATTFTVLHGTAGVSAGGGGDGGSGGAVTVTADIDLTTAESASLSGYKGNVKTFTFGGAAHKVTMTDVTDTSVTLTIESNPIVVTLNVGDIKRVDLNNDGTDDMEVTLESISSGRANIAMKKLVEGAEKVVEEEKKAAAEAAGELPEEAAGVEAPEEPVTEEAGLSTGVVVTIIVVIVILVVVGYFFLRKRS